MDKMKTEQDMQEWIQTQYFLKGKKKEKKKKFWLIGENRENWLQTKIPTSVGPRECSLIFPWIKHKLLSAVV